MTLLIIDGDVMAYHACKSRWEKTHQTVGGVRTQMLDGNGKPIPVEYTPEEDRKYLEDSWNNFKKRLQELQDEFYTDQYLMGVKGDSNYRDLLFPEYKANRVQDPRSIGAMFVPTIRKLAIKEDLAVPSHGRETDDLMRIWALQAQRAGDDYVICTVDKDLKCIPGKYFDMKKNVLEVITEEQALRHYYQQLLKGDPTDNIPGIPGVGDVKASKILAPYTKEEDFQEQLVDQYIRAYGDEWYSYLLSNAKMIHLQQDLNDYFSCSHWPIIKELLSV